MLEKERVEKNRLGKEKERERERVLKDMDVDRKGRRNKLRE